MSLYQLLHNTSNLEAVFLKIIEHADDGLLGSDDYARDRLRMIRDAASIGLNRISIGKGQP